MIKELNQTFKKVNGALGVSVKQPEPRKGILKAYCHNNGNKKNRCFLLNRGL